VPIRDAMPIARASPSLWLRKDDLDLWANTLGARDAFPALVADLIGASASDIDAYRFPSGDKGQVRGFDGSLAR
jgi:hypothetical protein